MGAGWNHPNGEAESLAVEVQTKTEVTKLCFPLILQRQRRRAGRRGTLPLDYFAHFALGLKKEDISQEWASSNSLCIHFVKSWPQVRVPQGEHSPGVGRQASSSQKHGASFSSSD